MMITGELLSRIRSERDLAEEGLRLLTARRMAFQLDTLKVTPRIKCPCGFLETRVVCADCDEVLIGRKRE